MNFEANPLVIILVALLFIICLRKERKGTKGTSKRARVPHTQRSDAFGEQRRARRRLRQGVVDRDTFEPPPDAPRAKRRRRCEPEIIDRLGLVRRTRVHADWAGAIRAQRGEPLVEARALAAAEVADGDEQVVGMRMRESLNGRRQRLGAERVEEEERLVREHAGEPEQRPK